MAEFRIDVQGHELPTQLFMDRRDLQSRFYLSHAKAETFLWFGLALPNRSLRQPQVVSAYLQVLRIFARSMRTYIIGRADVEGIPGGERMTAKKSGVSIGI